jgi:hypothetical protein
MKKIILAGILIGLLVGMGAVAFGEIPQILSYTGRLSDPAGRPISTTKALTFKIYSADTAGTLLWSSGTYAVTPDTGGVFSVLLGTQGDPVATGTFSDPNAYLEIAVEGTILSPRLRLVSVPYAYRSKLAETVEYGYLKRLIAGSNIKLTGIQSDEANYVTIEAVTDNNTIVTNGSGSLEVHDASLTSSKFQTISAPTYNYVLTYTPGGLDWKATQIGNVPIDKVTIGWNSNNSMEVIDGAITNAKIADGTINLTTKVTGLLPDANIGTISTAGKVSGNAITTGTIGGNTIINTTGNISGGTFTGDGSGLTGITATNATSLNGNPGSYYLNRANHTGTQSWSTIDTSSNKVSLASDVTGLLPNANLATINTAGKVDGGAITTGTIGGNTILSTTGTVTATAFYGDGSHLSGLIADNASSLDGHPASYYLDLTNISAGNLDWSRIITTTNKVNLASQVTGYLPNANLATIETPGWVSGNSITTGTIGGNTVINTTGNVTAGAVTATAYYGDGSHLTGLTANNAASLEGQSGAYYRDRANHTGTQSWETIVTAGTDKVDLTSQVKNYLPNTNLATIELPGWVSGNTITSGTIGGNTNINTTGVVTAAAYSGDGSRLNNVVATGIADYAVTVTKIATAAVTTAKLAPGAVTTAEIADASVTDAKLVSISSSKITGTVPPSAHAVSHMVGGSDIVTVETGLIANGAVTTAKIANNVSINTTGTVTAGAFTGDGSGVTLVNAFELNGHPGSYYTTFANFSGTLSWEAISTASAKVDLASQASYVPVNKAGDYMTGSLTLDAPAVYFGDGSGLTNLNAATLNGQAAAYYLNLANISTGNLDWSRIDTSSNKVNLLTQANYVPVNKAGDTISGNLTVEGAYYGDGSHLTNVVATGIANYAVTATKIATDAVTSEKIMDGAVSTADIGDGQVTNIKLAGAITDDKLNPITTAGKVSGAALYNLSNIPVPGGASMVIPNANLNIGTGADQIVALDGSGHLPASVLSSIATGEMNTASNVGSTGTGLFKQKTGANLEFYKLSSANDKLTITVVGTDHLSLEVNEGNFNVANMTGTIPVSRGGTGLTAPPTNGQLLIGNTGNGYTLAALTGGSGIIVANGAGSSTVALDINNGLTEVMSANNTDFLPIYNGSANKKITKNNLFGELAGSLRYKGAWNATTNPQGLASGGAGGVTGEYYVVNVSGTVSIDGVASWEVNDWIINAGAMWQKIQSTNNVASVFGRTGTITAQTGDYTAAQVGLGNVTDAAQIVRALGTAKGDIIVYQGAGNPSAEAVGGDGTVLTADSTQSHGVKWATVAIASGGTGQTTRQNAINALTNVSAASANQVLAKDGSNNASFVSLAGIGVPYTGATTTVNLGSQALTTSGLGTLGSLKTGYVYPSGDSATAFQVRKADGTTSVLDVNTTDGRVGIGNVAPGSELDVKGTIRLSGATSGFVGLLPAAAAGSTTYTLPSSDGSAGQVLTTNGAIGGDILSWSTVVTSASDAGRSGVVADLYESTTKLSDKYAPIAHVTATSGIHGVTGAIVGTSDAQTLSNKKFSNTVEVTAGGYKFSDGTTQSSAADPSQLVKKLGDTMTGTLTNSATTSINASGNAYLATAGGNVGIGTATPGATLEVNGLVKISGGSPAAGKVLTSDNNGLASWQATSGGGWSRSGSNVYLTNSGDSVGVGTASPSQKMEVNGTLKTSKYLMGLDLSCIPVVGGQSVITTWWGMQLIGNRQANIDYTPSNEGTRDDFSVIIPNQQAAKIGLVIKGKSGQTGNLQQWQDSNGTALSAIDASGNLGVGTASPGSAVDVKGTLRLSGATSGYVGLRGASAAGSTTYTLPSADGSAGQVLATSGGGVLSWATSGTLATDFGRSGVTTEIYEGTTKLADKYAPLAHASATSGVHGVTGLLVGTTDAQTLSNKTLVTPTIADFSNAMHNHSSNATGGQISHFNLTAGSIGTNTHAQIDTHLAAWTGVHGLIAGSAVVGTSDAQTLSNKKFSNTVEVTAVKFSDSTIQTTAADPSLFVRKTGDTMTGTLTIDSATANLSLPKYGSQLFVSGEVSFNDALFSTFLGRNVAMSNNGTSNVGVGYEALKLNTTGAGNTAVGMQALRVNTTGASNTAVGSNALYNHQTGQRNVAVGYNAMYNADGDNYNVGIGYYALRYAQTGADYNVGIGYQALNGNLSGYNNVAIGKSAMETNNSGYYNVALGNQALQVSTTSNNTAIGAYAGVQATAGANNTYLGYFTGYSNLTGSGNVFLGYQAGYWETGSNKLYIANDPNKTLIHGDFSANRVGINTTGETSTLTVAGTIEIKSGSGGGLKFADGTIQNSAATDGNYVLKTGSIITGTLTNTAGVAMSATGDAYLATGSSGKVGIGMTNPNNNLQVKDLINFNNSISGTFLGYQAGAGATGGADTAIGWGALNSGDTGGDNTAMGRSTLTANTSGNHNVAIGGTTMTHNTTGAYNTALGETVMNANTLGNYNVAIGQGALSNNTTGSNNTVLGYQAGSSAAVAGTGNVFLGYQAGQTEQGNGKLYIANSSTNPPLIHGDFATGRVGLGTTTETSKLTVAGTVEITSGGLKFADGTMQNTSARGWLKSTGKVTLEVASDKVGIGTPEPTANLSVNGSIDATGLTVNGQYNSTKYTGTTTVNWNNGNVQYVQLTNGTVSLTMANPKDGARYLLILKQPSSGAAGIISWPGTVKWPGGTAPTLTATNAKVDIVTFVYDGTNSFYYGGSNLNY